MSNPAFGAAPIGAVAVISGAGGDRRREAVTAAFRARGEPPEVFADGPLALAWRRGERRAAHVTAGTVCLLDGALYEMAELRRIAGSAGPAEQVLASAFERAGLGVLEYLRGEFWALLWNRRARRGIVVADQMGTQSPYWAREGGDLVLASEVPELLATLSRRPAPDPLSLAHWLALTAAPGGATLFAGLHRLEAAHYLPLGSGSGEPRRYWSPRYTAPERRPRDEAVASLREALAVAVRRRLADGACAGVLLSGGLDSSVVAALAARERPQLRAYSATFPAHPAVDESEMIDRTIEHLGVGSTRIAVHSGSVLAGALSYMSAWQLPPTSPNLFFWTLLLERASADGTQVMLDGEGGDELFGFSPFLLADRLLRGRALSAISLARRMPTAVPPPSGAVVRWRIRTFGLKGAAPAAAHSWARRIRGLDNYRAAWVRPDLAQEWLQSEESGYAWKQLRGPRWWTFLVEAVTRGVGPALVYEQSRRRASLAGLESRHPLVDVDVIELVLRLAPELALDSRFSRPLLRDSVAGLLPDEVRLRPAKSSFDALFHGALAGPDLAAVRRLLGAPDAELGAYVDLGAVRRMLLDPDPPAGNPWRQRWAIQVWRLLTAECWLRSQRDPSFLLGLAEQERLVATEHELIVRR